MTTTIRKGFTSSAVQCFDAVYVPVDTSIGKGVGVGLDVSAVPARAPVYVMRNVTVIVGIVASASTVLYATHPPVVEGAARKTKQT